MSDPLYRKEILRLAADAHGAGHLPEPHRKGEAFNPTCGDRVTFEVTTDAEGRIQAVAHETKACVLAQASASILGRDAKNLSAEEIGQLRRDISAMLKESAPVPDAPFTDYAVFDGVMTYPSRHACVLLPIDALLDALEK
ncbi:MAG TPA: iron-sulfur cluster assembly scaffold protein [Rhizomicrobium sp.]|nr:iron-sulfur cluster assembly scaffold protein [Rhizomicrobium sp.]